MTQSVDEQIGAFPAIEPELHLVQVGCEMLGTDLVPRSDDAAFQKRERGFNRVSGDARAVLVAGIFFGIVVDGFVFQIADGGFVGWQLVGNDYVHIGADVLLDVLCQRSFAGILSMEETNIAAALPDANHHFFVISSALEFFSAMLAADIGFVHLYSTVQHRAIYFLHGRPDAMAQVPRRFVRAFVLAPDRALKLTGAHSFFRFAKKQDGHKPKRQGQVGIVEDRASSYGELVAALATGKLFARINPPDVAVFAARAFNAFGPTEPGQNLAAIFVSGELLVQFRERHDRTS